MLSYAFIMFIYCRWMTTLQTQHLQSIVHLLLPIPNNSELFAEGIRVLDLRVREVSKAQVLPAARFDAERATNVLVPRARRTQKSHTVTMNKFQEGVAVQN